MESGNIAKGFVSIFNYNAAGKVNRPLGDNHSRLDVWRYVAVSVGLFTFQGNKDFGTGKLSGVNGYALDDLSVAGGISIELSRHYICKFFNADSYQERSAPLVQLPGRQSDV